MGVTLLAGPGSRIKVTARDNVLNVRLPVRAWAGGPVRRCSGGEDDA